MRCLICLYPFKEHEKKKTIFFLFCLNVIFCTQTEDGWIYLNYFITHNFGHVNSECLI